MAAYPEQDAIDNCDCFELLTTGESYITIGGEAVVIVFNCLIADKTESELQVPVEVEADEEQITLPLIPDDVEGPAAD